MHRPSFTDDEKQLVLQLIRQFDETELEATAPSSYLIVFAGEHYFAEFFHFFIGVFIGSAATEAVKLLVIVIFHSLADGS